MKLERLRQKLATLNVDGMLITNEFNRKYITGFTGSTGVVLISLEKAEFLTDFRYIHQAKSECQGFNIIEQNLSKSYPIIVNERCQKLGIRKLAFEQTHMTFADYHAYEEKFTGELVPVSGVIEELRQVKTAEEIVTIQTAADIADAAFKHILEFIRPGQTEIEIATELEFFMRKAGATCSSFDTIVASGWRSALPHGIASKKVIQKGEMITMDYGAVYNHYVSDMTRTIALGDPGEKLREVYEVVLAAQLAVCNQLKPGMTGKDADEIARAIIRDFGYGECFGHSLGHGIGLEVHEGPNLSTKNEQPLVAGNIVTNEPGIYLPDLGGVRIEDDMLITTIGNEALTISTKDLIIL